MKFGLKWSGAKTVRNNVEELWFFKRIWCIEEEEKIHGVWLCVVRNIMEK